MRGPAPSAALLAGRSAAKTPVVFRAPARCTKSNPKNARLRRAIGEEYNRGISRNRQLELARYARYRKKRSKEKHRIEARESRRRNRNAINERRRERTWRLNAGKREIEHGLALAELSQMQMRSPRFHWLDAQGRLHVELWETPEELAARLKLDEKKGVPQ